MPKTDSSFNPDEYAPVADRITLFYARFPNGRILTEMVARTDTEIVFKASVYRSSEDAAPATTGWAAERIGDGDINTVACLENTETSAIGRALANLGLTAGRPRPSLEEMMKAVRERVRWARRSSNGDGVRPLSDDGDEASTTARVGNPQHAADRINDALILLAQAERAGLPDSRSASIRAMLLAPDLAPADAERIERRLRRYLASREHA